MRHISGLYRTPLSVNEIPQSALHRKVETKRTTKAEVSDEAVVEEATSKEEKWAVQNLFDFASDRYVLGSPKVIEILKQIGSTLKEKHYYSEWRTLKPQLQQLPLYEQSIMSSNPENFKWLKKYDVKHSCLVLRAGVDLDLVIKKAVKYVQQDCQSDDPLAMACYFFVRFYRTAYLCECDVLLCSRRRS
jgi:hypothetical protein